ncbi:MAG: HI0074 family nucleotidyltransferase substrate-binding subunit [Calditrichia bacterium]|nr:HI0074 family nucleotidyltransferase substrate-binding subunit [Calditrichia bacterium]
MEQSKKFSYKLAAFRNSVSGFVSALNIDLEQFNPEITDVIKNGQIQKFEICAELTWKVLKFYLDQFHGIDTKSPKETIKEVYLIELINEAEYELLLDMLKDRNRLSHEYRKEYFEEIIQRLTKYRDLLLEILKRIDTQDVRR